MNYYNELDPYCAQWLRNLIHAKLIPEGHVDTRDIRDVTPGDLTGFTQCHFFAGIAGWPRALALASVPPDRPLWTGSCPCQPLSAAGARRGAADDRHLWPHWFYLIRVCKPSTVLGEQVAAAIGMGWLDAVFLDLESQIYACGAAVLPACGVGAPHRRERLFFVAHAPGYRFEGDVCEASPQAAYYGAPETLGPWHGTGNPFEEWRKLLGESAVSRMDDGISSTLDIRPRLHAYGNSIVPQVAAEFIKASL